MRFSSAAAGLLATWGLLGCGQVVFVDPDAEAKARLQLSGAEHLVVRDDPRWYLHVRFSTVTATAGLQLVATTPDGTFQLPWTEAAASACPDQTCFSFTLAPGLPAPTAVALLAPDLGHRHEIPVTVRRLDGYRLGVEVRTANTEVRIDLLDPIRLHYADPLSAGTGTVTRSLPFARRFEAHVAAGGCGSAPAAAAQGWRTIDGPPDIVAAPFGDGEDPMVCVWIRPAAPRQGPAVASRTVEVRAVVRRFRYVYTPPVEISPIVFLPLFDLEIPDPTRCQEAEELVLSAVLDAATRIADRTGVEVLALQPEEIAEVDGIACRQTNARRFDADAVARRTQDGIRAAFGEQRVRVVWIYAQNLDLAIPNAIDGLFQRMRTLLDTQTPHLDYFFTLAPDRVQDQLQSDRHLAWLATEEPQFRTAIGGILTALWPFTTVVHSPDTVVSMTPPELGGRFEAFRICQTSELVTAEGEFLNFAGAVAPGPAGPAFRVNLFNQVLLPSSDVAIPTVVVEWEGCEAFCDRPAPESSRGLPWLEASGC